jgi:PAS domain S-box-containing protein
VLRQLRRLGLAAGAVPEAAAFEQLLARISQAYADTDQDRYLLERSQAVASLEMAELNSALQASQARLSSLLGLSSDWVWEQNPKGRFTFVSDSMAQRSGVDHVVLLGQTFTTDGALRVAAPDLARWRGHLARREAFRDLTFELTAGDGRICHMSTSGEPWFDGPQFKGYRGVGVDVTTAVEADRRLQDTARRRLQAQLDFTSRLLEVNPTPVFVKDEIGCFVSVNAAWLDLMGFTLDQVVGRNSSELFGDEGPLHSQHDERLLQSEEPVRYENRLLRPGRSPRDTVVTKVRFTHADGSAAGIIGSIVDVTEFRQAERATREARDAAEAANRAKSEFIANISHELRTPLQSIVGFSELGAMRATDQPRWQEVFRDIHDGGLRMLHLVNALLDLSKAGDMSASLSLKRMDLSLLADGVLKELWPLAEQRGVRFEQGLAAGTVFARVDEFRFQQVLRNLLANALRFAPAGSTIALHGQDCGAAGVQLQVRDRGPGIPPAELESIFNPFVQSSRTRDGSGGTGLGLTISRKIIDAHGGRLQAANAEGGGAVMHIHLPPPG